MDVRCERCKTEYELPDARVTEAGVPVKCTVCGYVFRVKKRALVITVPIKPDEAEGATTLPPAQERSERSGDKQREWRIRQPEGSIILLKELTTLQRWIVERKVSRNDEISLTGETWKRLGDIPELNPFFQVVDDAQMGQQMLRHQQQAAVLPPPPPAPPLIAPMVPLPAPDAWASLAARAAGGGSPFPRAPSGEHPSIPPFAENAFASLPMEEEAPEPRPSPRGVRSAARSGGSAARSAELDSGSGMELDFSRKRRSNGLLLSVLVLGALGAASFYYQPWRYIAVVAHPDAPPPSPRPNPPEPVPPTPAPVVVAAPVAPAPAADAGVVQPEVKVAQAVPVPDAGVASPPPPPKREPVRDFDHYMSLGDRLRVRDRTEAAMDAYGHAVDLAPERAEGYAGRGLALLDMGRRPLAEASFQQALKLNPHYSVALMGLAETYRVMGKKDDAIQYYQKYLEIAPNGTEAAAANAAIQKLRE